MVKRISLDSESDSDSPRRWMIPSFLVRNYHFGYERECFEYFFGGNTGRGARVPFEEEDAPLDSMIELIVEPKKQ